MIKLRMHSSNFKYVYDPVIDPYSPTCMNCEFMPDNECGWGYQYLDECVFQVEKDTAYILHPNSNLVLDEKGRWGIMESGVIKYYSDKWHRIDVLPEEENLLVNYLENAEICGLNPYFSSNYEIEEFYNNSWDRRDNVKKKLKDKEWDQDHGWQFEDYIKWMYKRDPCYQCGKVTEEFILLGRGSRFRNIPVLKICKGCIGSMDIFCDQEFLMYGE